MRRGDVIRCTVVFEDKQKIGGKVQVPVVFYENGSRVLTRGERPCIEYDPDKPLYPYIAFRYKNSVLFKVKLYCILYLSFEVREHVSDTSVFIVGSWMFTNV